MTQDATMGTAERDIWVDALDGDYDAFANPGAGPADAPDDGAAVPAAPSQLAPAGDDAPDEAPAIATSDDERLAALFESMPTRRKVLLGVLDLCRAPQPAEGLAAQVDALQARNQSVFSGATLIELLEKAGGLRHINEDGSAYEPPAADDGEEEAEAPGDAGQDGPTGDSDDVYEVEYLEVEQPAPTFWATTDAGLAALAADDPRARLEQLLEDDAAFASAYREILEALADGPLAKPQIDVIVKANASAQAGRRLGGYFVDRLEKVDAIAWDGAWAITDLGRAALDLEALYR